MSAPPPVPSREGRRPTLSQVEVNPEDYAEEIPTEIGNGDTLEEQTAAPECYRWYHFTVEGNENDIVHVEINRTVRAGAANIFVNYPPSENYPTKEIHDWNPTLGPLEGPTGTYRVSVQGVPSFIEKDDKWLVSEDSNWTTFDLYCEWYLLDEETKKIYKETKEKYTREAKSSVWSSSYSKEVAEKYEQQQEEFQKEQEEREQLMQKSEISLEGTPVTDKYELGDILGTGPSTVVRKVKEKASGKQYAMKIINKEEALEMGLELSLMMKQGEVVKSLDHKNIPSLHESVDTEKAICLVLDLCQGGEILPKLASDPSSAYTEETVRKIVLQLLETLKYLHSKDIVHGELIPANILLEGDESSNIKLVGFTFAHDAKEDTEYVSGGDAAFQAPEILNRAPWGKAVDLWQVGCITYLLLSGVPPFSDNNTIRLYSKIRQGKVEYPDAEWKNISAEAKEFVEKLLVVDASTRLNVENALNHPWIKSSSSGSLPNVRANLAKLLN